MSWKATSWVKSLRTYTDGTPLTVREKFVLLILADYHNEENGYAWVSYNRLAHEALTDRTTVIRLLKKLHLDSGLLRVVRRTKAAANPSQPLTRLIKWNLQTSPKDTLFLNQRDLDPGLDLRQTSFGLKPLFI